MARSNDGTASNKMTHAAAAVTAVPCTLACWFNPVNVTTYYTLMSVYKQAAGTDSYGILGIAGATGGDPVIAEYTNGSTYANAATSSGYSASTWQHACAVFSASNARAAYLNGGSEGTNTTAVAGAAAWDGVQIGGYSDGDGDFDGLNGSIAEAGIWSVALTTAEILSLSKGVCPLLIRPASLVSYFPLIGRMASPEQDRRGNRHLTISAGWSQAAHPPRIFYPTSPNTMFPGGAGGAPAPIICHLSTTGGWVF